MSISKINVNKPVNNNGGISINIGDSNLITTIQPGNTNKTSGSSAIIGSDTFKPSDNENYNTNSPIFSFTPRPIQTNQTIISNNITYTQNGLNFTYAIYTKGTKTIGYQPHISNFPSQYRINTHNKNRILSLKQQIYSHRYTDPYGDEENQVPMICTGITELYAQNKTALTVPSDIFSRQHGTFDIFLYYCHEPTDVFYPGLGWGPCCASGGHRCNNAFFKPFIKIENRYFSDEVINFNNLTNRGSSPYIKNPTPYDIVKHITIPVPREYALAFLTKTFTCGKTSSAPEVKSISSAAFGLVPVSGVSHSFPLTAYVVYQDLILVEPTPFQPICDQQLSTLYISSLPSLVTNSSTNYYQNSVIGKNMLGLAPYSITDDSSNFYSFDSIDQSCQPTQDCVIPSLCCSVKLSISGIKKLYPGDDDLIAAINEPLYLELDSAGFGTSTKQFRKPNNVPYTIKADVSATEDGIQLASLAIFRSDIIDPFCGGYPVQSYISVSNSGIYTRNTTYNCGGQTVLFTQVVDTSEATISASPE